VGRAISRASSALFVARAEGETVVAAPNCAPAKLSEAAIRSAACVLMNTFTFLHKDLWIWIKYRLVQQFDQRKIRTGI
jgi:hypothetical protein